MTPLAFYRDMLAKGVADDVAYALAEQFEADNAAKMQAQIEALLDRLSVDAKAEGRREKDRMRKRAAKAGKPGIPRNSAESAESAENPPEQKVSPTPPSKTQTLEPPYSPPTPSERKPMAVATVGLFEEAWNTCTPPMRKRSLAKEKTRDFWLRSARKAHGEAQLLGALKRYLREDPDVQRSGGPGFHLWLRDGKWEHYVPGPEPPAKPADPAVLAHRLQHFRDTGEWNPKWGPQPQDRAA